MFYVVEKEPVEPHFIQRQGLDMPELNSSIGKNYVKTVLNALYEENNW